MYMRSAYTKYILRYTINYCYLYTEDLLKRFHVSELKHLSNSFQYKQMCALKEKYGFQI